MEEPVATLLLLQQLLLPLPRDANISRPDIESVTKLVPSAKADSIRPTFGVPGTAVPGYHMPPLRGWGGVSPTVSVAHRVS